MRKFITLSFVLCSFIVFAQTEETNIKEQSMDDLLELSLEDLMNMQVSVSTKQSVNIRETPGIVSVITKEDIENSGARDMVDLVQRYVPGFEFGSDVEGVVGIGVRGIWSYEGKLLLLIDGMEANETMFGNSIFGNHYLLENVERIEIIRGPGSVIYGGYASMGVINIITKNPESSGGNISYLASHTGKSFTHNNLSFSNQIVNNDLKISFFGDFGNGSRSDKDIVGLYGDKRSMSGNSDVNIRSGGFKVNYKKLKINAMMMDYNYQTIDLWDSIYQKVPPEERFSDFLSQASYEFKANENITITPKISYKWQKPWNLNTPQLEYTNNKVSEKLVAGVMGNYVKNKLNILVGFDYNYETLKQPAYVGESEEVFKDGTNKLKYNAFDTYAQLGLNTKFANITAGIRYDKSNLFGQAFAPRIGITKAFEKFHLKAAINKAFRTPGGILPNRQSDGDPQIKPEESFTYEFEAGAKLPANFYMIFNFFNTDFEKVIVYETQSSGIGLYKNGGNLGTFGFETTLRHTSNKLNAEINFAYYQRKSSNTDDYLMVSLDKKHFLGFSPIKINAIITYKITEHLRITPNVSFFGHKYDYTSVNDAGDDLKLEKLKNKTLINCNITYSDLLTKGLCISLGINNLLNEKFVYNSGVKSTHAPIPGLDRSMQIKISYKY